ncbi:MAG: hypothetical protein H6812_07925 [Phycisphaeraceae bacterium]|nr:hypothetical protein [Phycisphaerales bacterium]MCB9843173.1 hypothetical protein [Phycisphaeraceae bacterium]
MAAQRTALRAFPLLAVASAASTTLAAPITDRAFFDFLNPTVIDFETDGAGAPVSLIQGQIATLPANEYAAQGVRFNQNIAWVNDGNAQFDAAQFLAATPVVSIPSSQFNAFSIHFDVPVEAFGMFVANNRVADPTGPSFTAYDSDGMVIETATWGASFIDGGFSLVDYGFMGISSPGVSIARVDITKQAAILDDLTFSVIPAPGVLSALAGAGLLGVRRRCR